MIRALWDGGSDMESGFDPLSLAARASGYISIDKASKLCRQLAVRHRTWPGGDVVWQRGDVATCWLEGVRSTTTARVGTAASPVGTTTAIDSAATVVGALRQLNKLISVCFQLVTSLIDNWSAGVRSLLPVASKPSLLYSFLKSRRKSITIYRYLGNQLNSSVD
jgi:hypothetical protein